MESCHKLSRKSFLLGTTIKYLLFKNIYNTGRLKIFSNVFYKSYSNTSITQKSKDLKYRRRIFYITLPFASGLLGYNYWRTTRTTQSATNFEIRCYCALPLRTISRWWGWIADVNIPVILRPFVYGLYSKTFGVNLSEAKNDDYKVYSTLSDFFCRELKENARIIDETSALISPCDGIVLNFGTADSGVVEQVKGVNYNLKQFLGDNKWCIKNHSNEFNPNQLLQNKNNKLYQCTIYLAPGDYHRFHSPTDWQPIQRQHFCGELLSVNPEIASWIPDLFVLNERVSYSGYWKDGFFSMTAVGATNVGKIRVFFDQYLDTNLKHHKKYECCELKFNNNIKLKKGELFGEFRMGSTIVLIFEAKSDFQFALKCGGRIRMGESLIGVNNNTIKHQYTSNIVRNDSFTRNR